MLQSIRKSVRSFSIKFLMVLLVLSFVTFYGYNNVTGCNPSAIATVNGVLIQQEEYTARMRLEIENYRRLLNRDVEASFLSIIQKSVLDRMINNVLLAEEAESLGLDIADAEVKKEIERTFTDPNTKKFDIKFYRNYVMRYMRTTPRKYEENVRAELATGKFRDFIESMAKVSKDEAKALYNYENRELNFDFVALDPKTVELEAALTDAELKDYYDKHQADFQTKEERKAEYVVFDPKDYGAPKEKSEVVEAKIRRQAEKLMRAADSDRQKSLKDNLGKIKATHGTTDFFEQESTITGVRDSALFADKAFSLEVGEVSDLTKGFISGNFYLLKLLEVSPPKPQAFDQVKSAVEINLVEERRQELTEKRMDEAVAKLQQGASVDEVAKTLNLETDETGFFKSTARSIPKAGFSVDANQDLFTLSLASNVEARVVDRPIKIGSRYFAFRLKDERAGEVEDMDKAISDEQRKLLRQRRPQVANSWIRSLREKAEADEAIVIYNRPQQQ